MYPRISLRIVTLLPMVAVACCSRTGTALADAMQPWSGASVNVYSNGNSDSANGPTALARTSGSGVASYYNYGGHHEALLYHLDYGGKASASAGLGPDQLLVTNAEYHTANPGTVGGPSSGLGMSASSALWTNDAVSLMPPPGGALPDMIRLNLAVNFTHPNSMWTGNGYYYELESLVVRANDQAMQWGAGMDLVNGHLQSDASRLTAFDSVIDDPSHRSSVANFHLDLPVNKATGVSDPFSLRMAVLPMFGIMSNWAISSDMKAVLSLKDITLPDGTSLASKGYGVQFASGLSSPSPVPEPTSFVAWGVLAFGGGWIVRWRATKPSLRGAY